MARTAVAALEADFNPETDDLAASLELVLRRLKGVVIPPGSWNWEALPPHLRFTFTVIDAEAKILDESQELAVLQQTLAAANRSALARSLGIKPGAALPAAAPSGNAHGRAPGAASGQARGTAGNAKGGGRKPASRPGGATAVATTVWERSGLADWDTGLGLAGTITEKVVTEVAGQQVTAYPALLDTGTDVRLTVFRNPAEQLAAHRTGVIRLLLLKVPSPSRYVLDHLNNTEKLVFTQNPHGSVEALIRDCTMAAVDKLVPAALPFTKAAFDALYEKVRAELIDTVFTVTAIVEKVLSGTRRINKDIKSASSLALVNALNDVKSQLEQLVYPGFVAKTGYAQLAQLPRYISAIEKRLEKLGTGHLARDNAATLDIQSLEDEYDAALGQLVPGARTPAQLAAVKWMLEEYRVSLFAQELGTAYSVSAKRIRAAMREGLAAAK